MEKAPFYKPMPILCSLSRRRVDAPQKTMNRFITATAAAETVCLLTCAENANGMIETDGCQVCHCYSRRDFFFKEALMEVDTKPVAFGKAVYSYLHNGNGRKNQTIPNYSRKRMSVHEKKKKKQADLTVGAPCFQALINHLHHMQVSFRILVRVFGKHPSLWEKK
ncbi:hypothetical protein CEXT_793361 [Caerostris extrusa]|uniref:Uncharacterized protein n=1 Tax=Caerostris extrusa TaxID=172846 RepID=A0AAV4ST82_CAEEX|nr:hypothetical protein CEXT_793361 [Caerostris extrusa]